MPRSVTSNSITVVVSVVFSTMEIPDGEENARFAESLELDYPILCDPTREMALAYGVVDDENGLAERWTFYIGADREILHIDQQVNTDEHGADVAAKLADLGVSAAAE